MSPDPLRRRILYIITRAEHGGAQTHIVDLLDGVRAHYDVEVAVGEEGFLTTALRTAGVPVHILPALRRDIDILTDIRAVGQAVALIRRVRPDLIHAHTAKAGTVGRLAARICGVPSVYTVHMWPFGDGTPSSWQYFGPAIERTVAKFTKHLIAVSNCGAQTGLDFRIAPREKIITIHNGVADTPYRAAHGRNLEPVIAMVARFSNFKDHPTLLRAFALAGGSASLLLVGDGSTRPAIQQLTQELGLTDRVRFLGDRDDVPQILATADVFVLASHLEHLPISILEAMRAGLPVIASNVGGVHEAVVDGESGFVVPPENVNALAGALRKLLGSSPLRAAMGQASRLRYESGFSAAKMVESTEDVYDRILRATAEPIKETTPAKIYS